MLHNIYENIYVTKDEPLFSAVKHILKRNINFIPILESGILSGIVLRKDIESAVNNIGDLSLKCGDFLKEYQGCLRLSDIRSMSMEQVTSLLKGSDYNYKPVCENNGEFVGLISNGDLFRYAVMNTMGSSIDSDTSYGLIAWDKEERIVYVNERIKEITKIRIGESLERLGQRINSANINFSIITNSIYIKYNDITVGVICFEQGDLEFISKILSQDVNSDQQDLSSILNTLSDGVYVTNAKGITIIVNSAWEKITGISAFEVIGKNIRELEGEGFFYPTTTMEVLKTGEPVSIVQKLSGGKQLICTGSPVVNYLGEITKVVTSVRDITELVTLNEKLASATSETENYKNEIKQLRLDKVRDTIIAEDSSMKYVCEMALQVAQVDSTILITGESGVGKEVIAELIQKNSNRKDKPYLQINCSAIPENLLESEFFGYEGGSFTGAFREGKVGIFEMADGGTILLDEIGDLHMGLQAKLLRVLQTGEFKRVGGTKKLYSDARIIAVTNKDLKKLVKEGHFRSDLFYRLNVVPITVPPLRSRQKDIGPLTHFFFDKFNRKYKRSCYINRNVLKLFFDYDWPGNVRELENVVERLIVTSPDNEIKYDQVIEIFNTNINLDANNYVNVVQLAPMKEIMDEAERQLMELANKRYRTTYEIAKVLGVSQPTVVRKLQRYNLNR